MPARETIDAGVSSLDSVRALEQAASVRRRSPRGCRPSRKAPMHVLRFNQGVGMPTKQFQGVSGDVKTDPHSSVDLQTLANVARLHPAVPSDLLVPL